MVKNQFNILCAMSVFLALPSAAMAADACLHSCVHGDVEVSADHATVTHFECSNVGWHTTIWLKTNGRCWRGFYCCHEWVKNCSGELVCAAKIKFVPLKKCPRRGCRCGGGGCCCCCRIRDNGTVTAQNPAQPTPRTTPVHVVIIESFNDGGCCGCQQSCGRCWRPCWRRCLGRGWCR